MNPAVFIAAGALIVLAAFLWLGPPRKRIDRVLAKGDLQDGMGRSQAPRDGEERAS